MTWKSLLESDERANALELVRSIALALRHRLPVASPSLMGTAGVAIFLAYAESTGVIEDGGVEAILVETLRAASATRMPIGLWTGCSGLRWAVEHLAHGEGARSVLGYLDDAVERGLAAAPRDVSFDVYSGVAGVLLAYAESRTAMGRRIVGAALDRLAAIDWNLTRDVSGCAHGFAGVIAALARCVIAGVEVERARGLLDELLARVVATNHRGARVCWCRGESGTALALLSAASALQHAELEVRATAMALAPFRWHDGEWPADATICHGTAGLAHMCNRAYQATGNAELGDHARDWLRRTIACHQPGAGIAGFRSLRRTPEPRWEENPTLLVGAAGVGLVLLAGASSLEPRWDRLLAADVS